MKGDSPLEDRAGFREHRGVGALPLEGRGIGVSGGGGHLGSAVALGLAEAGALVVVCGRHADPLNAVVTEARERKTPGRVFAEPADVRSEADLARVLNRIIDVAGGLHGWVNNAYGGSAEPFMEITRKKTEQTLSSGLADLRLATQEVAKRMRPTDFGSIVNVASMYGLVSPQPEVYREFPEFHNPPAYGAAKAGVVQFTRYAACHLATRGIRVNSVSPGPFPRPEIRAQAGFLAELEKRVPLGRVGDAEELAGPIAFLLSRASSFVTGHDLVVDGGWTAW